MAIVKLEPCPHCSLPLEALPGPARELPCWGCGKPVAVPRVA